MFNIKLSHKDKIDLAVIAPIIFMIAILTYLIFDVSSKMKSYYTADKLEYIILYSQDMMYMRGPRLGSRTELTIMVNGKEQDLISEIPSRYLRPGTVFDFKPYADTATSTFFGMIRSKRYPTLHPKELDAKHGVYSFMFVVLSIILTLYSLTSLLRRDKNHA